jgi:hypothetical protein
MPRHLGSFGFGLIVERADIAHSSVSKCIAQAHHHRVSCRDTGWSANSYHRYGASDKSDEASDCGSALIPDLRDPFDFLAEPLADDVPADLRGWRV